MENYLGQLIWMLKRLWGPSCLMVFSSAVLFSQQLSTPPSSQKLAFIIPGIIDQFLQAPSLNPALLPILQSTVNPSFASVNTAIATQLSNLPVPSPASGYKFDPQLGVYVPSGQSLGPILSERGETIGKGKFFFALTYQRFLFDRLDDLDLRNINLVIPVRIPPDGPIQGLITTNTYIGLNISQTTAYFTYGVTHWLDVSYALPIISSSMTVRAGGSVRVPGLDYTAPFISVNASSTGIGDQIVRLKASFLGGDKLKFAFATDFRLPTGDEFNYHGAGAYGVKPFLVASLATSSLSPHINAGYQWNGASFLASRSGMQKQPLPGQIFYALGFDTQISPRMTLSADFIDQLIIHGQRSLLQPFSYQGSTYQTLYFANKSRQELNAAAGFKARLRADLVFTGNVLFRLNEVGLRARVVPMVGISYTF